MVNKGYYNLYDATNQLYSELDVNCYDIWNAIKKHEPDYYEARGTALIVFVTDAPIDAAGIEIDKIGKVDDEIINEFIDMDLDDDEKLDEFAKKHNLAIYNISEYDTAFLIFFLK